MNENQYTNFTSDFLKYYVIMLAKYIYKNNKRKKCWHFIIVIKLTISKKNNMYYSIPLLISYHFIFILSLFTIIGIKATHIPLRTDYIDWQHINSLWGHFIWTRWKINFIVLVKFRISFKRLNFFLFLHMTNFFV